MRSSTTSSFTHNSWLLLVAALFLACLLAMVSAEPISTSGLAPTTTHSETATPAPVEPEHILVNERTIKDEKEAAAVEDMPDFNLRDDEALERMRDELDAREQRLRMMELAAEPESPATSPAEGPASARGPDFQTHGPWGRRWGWGFGYPGFGFGWGWGYPGFGWGYPGFGWGGWW